MQPITLPIKDNSDFTFLLHKEDRVKNSYLSHRIIITLKMCNSKIKIKAWSFKTGFNFIIIHFYIRRKLGIIRYDT